MRSSNYTAIVDESVVACIFRTHYFTFIRIRSIFQKYTSNMRDTLVHSSLYVKQHPIQRTTKKNTHPPPMGTRHPLLLLAVGGRRRDEEERRSWLDLGHFGWGYWVNVLVELAQFLVRWPFFLQILGSLGINGTIFWIKNIEPGLCGQCLCGSFAGSFVWPRCPPSPCSSCVTCRSSPSTSRQ